MESNYQHAVLQMVAHSAAVFPIGPDGSVRSINIGTLIWQPRLPTAQELTGTFAHYPHEAPSAASCAVGNTDLAKSVGEPYCAEVSDATSLDSSLDITPLAKSAGCCAVASGHPRNRSGHTQQRPRPGLPLIHQDGVSTWNPPSGGTAAGAFGHDRGG